MANESEARTCANEPCTCMAPLGQAYCGAACEHAATSGPPREEPVCECSHVMGLAVESCACQVSVFSFSES